MSARSAWLGWALAVAVVIFGFDVHARTAAIAGARSPSPRASHGDDRASTSSSVVPSLTPEQRTALQLRVLIYRNAQLELEALVKDLQVPGYTIDLSQLAYVKQEKAVAP